MSDDPTHLSESPKSSQPASTRLQSPDERERQVADLVDQFFEQQQAGEQPDSEALIAAHPDLAEELRECLDALQLVSPAQQHRRTFRRTDDR